MQILYITKVTVKIYITSFFRFCFHSKVCLTEGYISNRVPVTMKNFGFFHLKCIALEVNNEVLLYLEKSK